MRRDSIVEFRNPLAISAGTAYIVIVLVAAPVIGWAQGFPPIFPIAQAIAVLAALLLWRIVITPRVEAGDAGVSLVRGFRPDRSLGWREIDRFWIRSYRLPPWRKAGYLTTIDGRDIRLPGLMMGRARREQEYLTFAIRLLEGAREVTADGGVNAEHGGRDSQGDRPTS